MLRTDSVRLELRIAPGTTVDHGAGAVSLRARCFNHTLPHLPPGSVATIARLAQTPTTDDELAELVLGHDGFNGLLSLQSILYQLDSLGALARTVTLDGLPLATLSPMGAGVAFRPEAASADQRYMLSRFAYVRRIGEAIEVESPLGQARVCCHDRRMGKLLIALAQPSSPTELAHLGELPEAALIQVLGLLINANVVCARPEGTAADEDELTQPLGGWEFQDLLFHTRSRFGRHDNPYGGTFHMKGRIAPPPAIAERPWQHDIVLPQPDIDVLRSTDAPFADIVERRRSIREYGEVPIGLDALGVFLFRVARVQKLLKLPEGEMDLSLRPYPGGGAIHELELYPVVQHCAGLEQGIYHYDPLRHRLGRVAAPARELEQLLEIAWQTADRKSRPQVFFVITARFRRMQWKYQSVSYAVILKNVGVLYEAMYLTATALGLAPCSLGGGPSDLFCKATGLDFYEESPVGEFVLGSEGSAP
jgi:SagB-type dehydrogenase family enzyme